MRQCEALGFDPALVTALVHKLEDVFPTVLVTGMKVGITIAAEPRQFAAEPPLAIE